MRHIQYQGETLPPSPLPPGIGIMRLERLLNLLVLLFATGVLARALYFADSFDFRHLDSPFGEVTFDFLILQPGGPKKIMLNFDNLGVGTLLFFGVKGE